MPDLWATVEEIGLNDVGVLDGADGETTLADAVALVKVAARHAAPVPLAESILAARAIAAVSLPQPKGPLASAAAGADLTIRSVGTSWRVEGLVRGVAWARVASHLVVIEPDGGHMFILPRTAYSVREGSNIAGEPRDEVLVSALLNSESVAVLPTDFRFDDWWRLGALLRSAQIVGAVDALLEYTIRYADARHQFGRPIRAFQVVQQELARLAGLAVSMGMAVDAAAAAAGQHKRSIASAVAKTQTSATCGEAVRIAHQIHGAIGMTREYPLHLWSRRIWAWRDEFGNERYWAAHIGQHLQERVDELWDILCDSSLHRNN